MSKRLPETTRYARELDRLETRAAALRSGRDAVIKARRKEGVPVTELAQETGLTRQQVYNILGSK